MKHRPPTSPGPPDGLSRDRVIAAAVELLDAGGERGLTTRALAEALSTGPGAIYHHVPSKDQVLAGATDQVVACALESTHRRVSPPAAIRRVCLAVFDALDEHPWAGSQLARNPGQPALIRIWSALGQHLSQMELRGAALTNAGSALVSYVLGAAAQYAAGARIAADTAERTAYLEDLADRLIADSDDASQVDGLRSAVVEHDDREQFLAGIDILLRGIGTTR